MIEGVDVLRVCSDCVVAIANDDFTGMDDTTERRVRAGIRCIALRTGGQLVAGGEALGFSWRECECCGALAGERYSVAVLV
jgi:hypothetical protein